MGSSWGPTAITCTEASAQCRHVVDAQEMLNLNSKKSGSRQAKNVVCVLSESTPHPLQGQLCEVRTSQGSLGLRGEPALDGTAHWGGHQEPSGLCSSGRPAPAAASSGVPAGALPGLTFLPPSPETRLLSSHIPVGVAKP